LKELLVRPYCSSKTSSWKREKKLTIKCPRNDKMHYDLALEKFEELSKAFGKPVKPHTSSLPSSEHMESFVFSSDSM
jgi:hypothetical protein